MTQDLARYLVCQIADDIDSRIYLNKYMSSYECEKLEEMFIKEDFVAIQRYLERKLAWDKQNETEGL